MTLLTLVEPVTPVEPGEPRSPLFAVAPAALSLEIVTVDVSELVLFAGRLHAHAQREGAAVSPQSIVAKAFLVASLQHPSIDARWPLLPARHGVRLSELTAALEGADVASPIPEDAAVLSISGIVERDGVSTLELRLAFDPRRTDAVQAHRLIDELAGLLADPWELVAHC